VCTAVDRQTRCLLAWTVSLTRDAETLQPLADQTGVLGPSRYFSDGYEVYRTLLYRQGQHAVAPGKSETYSVEGDNADLRHYLARLGRKSRCFSRSLGALARQVKLFVFCYNARQLFTRRFPKLKAHLIDFLPAPK
jgi:insertion element IS1 protein InsB